VETGPTRGRRGNGGATTDCRNDPRPTPPPPRKAAQRCTRHITHGGQASQTASHTTHKHDEGNRCAQQICSPMTGHRDQVVQSPTWALQGSNNRADRPIRCRKNVHAVILCWKTPRSTSGVHRFSVSTQHPRDCSFLEAGVPRSWDIPVLLLIPKFCPGGQRQRLTLNKSSLLV